MDLPPFAPFPFRVRRYRVGFLVSAHSRLDNPMSFEHLGGCVRCGSRHQSSRASRGKTRALLVSRPASAPFGSCKSDIGARSLTPARPPPGTHLAGSLFATYTSPASCFLQAAHYWTHPCLVGVAFRPITVAFAPPLGARAMPGARKYPPAKPGALDCEPLKAAWTGPTAP